MYSFEIENDCQRLFTEHNSRICHNFDADGSSPFDSRYFKDWTASWECGAELPMDTPADTVDEAIENAFEDHFAVFCLQCAMTNISYKKLDMWKNWVSAVEVSRQYHFAPKTAAEVAQSV